MKQFFQGIGFWIFILLTALLLYSGYIVIGSEKLPEKVATQFNYSGAANGWMTKSKNMVFFLVIGPAITLILVGIGSLIQYLPSKYLNAPHADHWRSAEHYPSACLFILKMIVILSIALVIFFGVTFHHVVQANQANPPQLNNTNMGISTTFLLLFVGGWTLTLYYFFLRKPQK